MIMIELPDEQAAALNARAAAMGLSLKGWLATLAQEIPTAAAEPKPSMMFVDAIKASSPKDIKLQPQAAVARLIELRKGNILPEGASIQDMIHARRSGEVAKTRRHHRREGGRLLEHTAIAENSSLDHEGTERLHGAAARSGAILAPAQEGLGHPAAGTTFSDMDGEEFFSAR